MRRKADEMFEELKLDVVDVPPTVVHRPEDCRREDRRLVDHQLVDSRLDVRRQLWK